MTNDFHFRNAPPSTPTPPSDLKAFDLHAHSGTDLWRKPATPTKPPVESDNAPSYLTNIPASSFRAAQVTVNAQWTRLYDQGGLIFYFPSSANKSAWLKTGIELYNNRANLSTVATPGSATSDWGLVPLQQGASKVTIRVEREEEDGKFGPSLWVYMIQEDGEKLAVREVTWVRIIFSSRRWSHSYDTTVYPCRYLAHLGGAFAVFGKIQFAYCPPSFCTHRPLRMFLEICKLESTRVVLRVWEAQRRTKKSSSSISQTLNSFALEMFVSF